MTAASSVSHASSWNNRGVLLFIALAQAFWNPFKEVVRSQEEHRAL